MATITTNGDNNNCLKFDGTDDYVDCGNDASLNITDAITIEAWVKPNTITDTSEIVSRGIDCSYQLQIINDDVRWKTRADSSVESIANNVLNVGEWAHLVGTYDGSEQKIYINGVEKDSDSQSGALLRPTYVTYIGCRENWPTPPALSRFFNGSIDEVRIWDRALSASQINALYLAGLPQHQ